MQFQINNLHNTGIKTTPCEAVYGKTASVGLRSSSLPPSVLDVEGIISEDDMEAMFAGDYTTSSRNVAPIGDIPTSSSTEEVLQQLIGKMAPHPAS